MVLNYIWIGFFLVALLVAIIKTFNGDFEVFTAIVNSTFNMAEISFEISIGLTGVLCLWLGIMSIGEKGGSIQVLSKLVGPFFSKLFPDVPKDHPARGSMLMNFSANMLGLDNAATPMGLKAMNELQELNPKKDTASKAQIMFLVLNTSGLTLIPITVMNYRNQFGAENPSDVFIPILISTFVASLLGLIIVSIYQKINLFNKVVLAYLGGLIAIVAGMLWYFTSLSPDDLQSQSALISNIILYGIICIFIVMALVKKVNVYEAFIDGAKGGFDIAIKIIPYLVAILVSIGVFRASGALDYLIDGLRWFFSLFLEDTRFVEGLPTAFMKPLSGTGARGMMLDAFEANGVDSFIGRLTATLQGATDTTFYIIAVYFGSVGIKKTRYAIKAGLLADLGGVVAAIFVAYMFFGGADGQLNLNNTQVVEQFAVEWNTHHESNLLGEDFTLFDQTYDQKNKTDLENVMPALNIVHLHNADEENSVLIKNKVNSEVKAYKFTIDKQKIQSIQLMGNFED
ncbi:MAG: nucleoside recognition domain-containing protein [Putridiphycobacter sp.]